MKYLLIKVYNMKRIYKFQSSDGLLSSNLCRFFPHPVLQVFIYRKGLMQRLIRISEFTPEFLT